MPSRSKNTLLNTITTLRNRIVYLKKKKREHNTSTHPTVRNYHRRNVNRIKNEVIGHLNHLKNKIAKY